MSYIFDPETLHGVVRRVLDSAPHGEPNLEQICRDITSAIADEYPGQITEDWDWTSSADGGGTQVVTLLHASSREYLTLVGTPLATGGYSGRYLTTIYDFIIDGELQNYVPGEFTRKRFRAGDVSIFEPGEARNYAVPDRLWMLEYARGPIPTMFALPLVDTFFGSLDFRSLFHLVRNAIKEMTRGILGRRGPISRGAIPWRNWYGNQRANPQAVFEARGLSDLRAVVERARNENRQVRMFGTGHSWSALVPTDDYLIDNRRMTRLLEYDQEANTLTVESGMTIGQLIEHAARHGLQVLSPTVALQFTVGGVVATGSHGTGLAARTFSDHVTAMTLVKADGTVETIDEHHPDMQAARVALGSLGIIYSVTLRCRRSQRNIRVVNRWLPLDEAISAIPENLAAYDAMSYFWFPTTSEMWLKLWRETDDPVTWGRGHQVLESILQAAEGVLGLLGRVLMTRWPRLTPAFMRLAARIKHLNPADTVKSIENAYHYEFQYPLCTDASFAIPIERSGDAWHKMIELVRAEAAAGRYPLNLMTHSRWTGASEALLSPDRGRDSCYIEALSMPGAAVEGFYRSSEQIWMNAPFDGRPHWGKFYFDLDLVRRQFPTLAAFETVRARWDPQGRFLNPFLQQVLRPPDGGSPEPN